MPVSRGRKPKKSNRPRPPRQRQSSREEWHLAGAPWEVWREARTLPAGARRLLEFLPFTMVDPRGRTKHYSLSDISEAQDMTVEQMVEGLENLAEVGFLRWDQARQVVFMTIPDLHDLATIGAVPN